VPRERASADEAEPAVGIHRAPRNDGDLWNNRVNHNFGVTAMLDRDGYRRCAMSS
jgi:hypothetical protein